MYRWNQGQPLSDGVSTSKSSAFKSYPTKKRIGLDNPFKNIINFGFSDCAGGSLSVSKQSRSTNFGNCSSRQGRTSENTGFSPYVGTARVCLIPCSKSVTHPRH